MSSAFEADFKKRFSSLKGKIRRSEKKLASIGNEILNTSKVMPRAYWKDIEKRVAAEYAKINTAYSSFSKTEIPRRFRNSVYQMHAKTEGLKSIIAKTQKTATKLIHGRATTQIVQALYQDSIARMLAATYNGQRNMISLIRATQQNLLDEAFINKTIAEAFEAGNVRKAGSILKGAFQEKLAESITKEQFIMINGRKYRPSYYSELLLRTKFHEAHSKAARATAMNYKTDLVIISSHNTTTKICIPFEGKVFSLSGKDKRFPVLLDEPPFHPNCLHLMYPQFESGMEAQGSLKAFIAFSNGNAARPPYPSNFTPISQRGIA